MKTLILSILISIFSFSANAEVCGYVAKKVVDNEVQLTLHVENNDSLVPLKILLEESTANLYEELYNLGSIEKRCLKGDILHQEGKLIFKLLPQVDTMGDELPRERERSSQRGSGISVGS